MSLIDELVQVCRKVYEKEFVSAYDGNISAKNSPDTFLITRSGICKGEVTSDDILEIDANGKVINGIGKASAENKLHLYAYSKRPEINAVIHCHPVYASAFAAFGEGLTKHVFPEVILTLGKVPLCEYATPSTDELSKTLEPYINYSWAFLLGNHGALTLGTDLKDAYFKMEKLEHTAKIIFLQDYWAAKKNCI